MQIEEQQIIPDTNMTEHEQVSLYRTQWLMAHNRLNKIAHDSTVGVAEEWNSYLRDLSTAESVAREEA
jgi:hypothetical protein